MNGFRCAHYGGPHRDAPGVKCRRPATGYHGRSGEYRVPTCDRHRDAGLYRLGSLFFGYVKG